MIVLDRWGERLDLDALGTRFSFSYPTNKNMFLSLRQEGFESHSLVDDVSKKKKNSLRNPEVYSLNADLCHSFRFPLFVFLVGLVFRDSSVSSEACAVRLHNFHHVEIYANVFSSRIMYVFQFSLIGEINWVWMDYLENVIPLTSLQDKIPYRGSVVLR